MSTNNSNNISPFVAGISGHRDLQPAAVAELGKDSLMESYLWTIHRFHRGHEPPGRT